MVQHPEIGAELPKFGLAETAKPNFEKASGIPLWGRPAHAGAGRVSHPKFVGPAREPTGLWTVISLVLYCLSIDLHAHVVLE